MMFKDRDTLKSSDIYNKKKKIGRHHWVQGMQPKTPAEREKGISKSRSRNRKKSYHEVKI